MVLQDQWWSCRTSDGPAGAVMLLQHQQGQGLPQNQRTPTKKAIIRQKNQPGKPKPSSSGLPAQKKHSRTGNLFLTMEVHIPPNPASLAYFGPDFRPWCFKNTPGGHRGHQRSKNTKNDKDFGVQKGVPNPNPGFVRQMSGMALGSFLAYWGIIWGP